MWNNILSIVRNIDIASFLCEESCRHCGQSVPSKLEQKRCDVSAQFKTGPSPTCLCLKCSELMWQSRQSIWSLPIVRREQPDHSDNLMGTKSGATQLLAVATAGMYEGPMQKLIRRLKYDDDRLVVADLGSILTRAYEMLLTAMPELVDDKDDIFLVPVPLHPSRQRKRGYNQAELIAREFAKLNHMRVQNGVLMRKRKTRPQYGLGRQDRLRNIDGAFEFGGYDVRNKTVIIVDDVFTSGATLTSCAALLTECGAKQVAAMAAARAPYGTKIKQAPAPYK